jgi:hypothetical protein
MSTAKAVGFFDTESTAIINGVGGEYYSCYQQG